MKNKLRVGLFGGLGKMASPMVDHLRGDARTEIVYVFDRGTQSPDKTDLRRRWIQHGAKLTDSLETFSDPTLDGVLICCGKNGDDLPLIQALIESLTATEGRKTPFICHLSTVSPAFVRAAHRHCRSHGVDYVNYPLTGGVAGALSAKLLILGSGDESLFEHLKATLQKLGEPRYFGPEPDAGARAKLMGHLMVFNGLIGICSAAAVFASQPLASTDIVEFFDFLNRGAGGTKQWDLVLRKGLANDLWTSPFSIKHACVDALYTAQLIMDLGLAEPAVRNVLEVAALLCYVAATQDPELATHTIFRDLLLPRSRAADAWVAPLRKHATPDQFLHRCIAALPNSLRQTVRLEIHARDFEPADA